MNFCACKNSTGAVCAQALLLLLLHARTYTHTAQRSHYLFCTWRPRNSFSAAAASAVLIPHAVRNCSFIQQYQVLMRIYRHLRRRCKTLLCKRAPAVASGSSRSLILQRRIWAFAFVLNFGAHRKRLWWLGCFSWNLFRSRESRPSFLRVALCCRWMAACEKVAFKARNWKATPALDAFQHIALTLSFIIQYRKGRKKYKGML